MHNSTGCSHEEIAHWNWRRLRGRKGLRYEMSHHDRGRHHRMSVFCPLSGFFQSRNYFTRSEVTSGRSPTCLFVPSRTSRTAVRVCLPPRMAVHFRRVALTRMTLSGLQVHPWNKDSPYDIQPAAPSGGEPGQTAIPLATSLPGSCEEQLS